MKEKETKGSRIKKKGGGTHMGHLRCRKRKREKKADCRPQVSCQGKEKRKKKKGDNY